MQVPLLDLKAQYQRYCLEVMPAVQAVLESQLVCNGPTVRTLEEEIASYSGCAAGVGVSSGTDALLAALMALGIGAGDEVITSPFTFFATAGTIWRTGARPVFVDIEPETFNIDPAKIPAAITSKTKAIIPVHLYGQMAEMDPIMAIAAKGGLAVIEDAAQSIGASYKGRKTGSVGTCGCLSFYPTKNLGAPGDAGMIVTNDKAFAAKCAQIRNHGQGGTYEHLAVGGNFRMDSITAAVLSIKLKYLEEWSAGRRHNAARYNELLAGVGGIKTPVIRPYNVSIFNQYIIRAKNRDALKAHLQAKGVASGVYYPLSLHQQPCFASLGYKPGDFPHSEQAAQEVLALPIYPEITDAQLQYVAATIKEFYAK
ncbi:MAG: DegT/DnrJ/EryC1/StrS family aminotransferase [Planctomycetaceae bacterium]|nr:DegT/DnrJ/EryC1/StrS family aminotransferase [Planctomycetaceae bacterium]